MKKILELKNISKEYKDYKALDNVSFSLNEGEIVGLIGPNGAGKTTLMRIIVGLTKQYDGEIDLIDNTSIGCVIETPSFYPYMTGYENLRYLAELNDVSAEKVMETIELLGLKEALNKKVKGYSLGMRQRLGIAAALLREPKLLILDEPTNGLDPTGIHELRTYIKDIAAKKGITVLISSHILSELEKICDKAIIIKHGKIIDVLDVNKWADYENMLITVKTNDVINAKRVFLDNKIEVIEAKKDQISVSVNKEVAYILVELLTSNNIKFTGLYEEKQSLEDTFLDIIDGNNIV